MGVESKWAVEAYCTLILLERDNLVILCYLIRAGWKQAFGYILGISIPDIRKKNFCIIKIFLAFLFCLYLNACFLYFFYFSYFFVVRRNNKKKSWLPLLSHPSKLLRTCKIDIYRRFLWVKKSTLTIVCSHKNVHLLKCLMQT